MERAFRQEGRITQWEAVAAGIAAGDDRWSGVLRLIASEYPYCTMSGVHVVEGCIVACEGIQSSFVFSGADAEASPARLAGWGLSAELPGFHKVYELKRRMTDAKPVGQMVYSDGLAAVSVFIEPLEARRGALSPGIASMGAIHVYTREVANHRVTVVGEAPAASVQRIANAVEFRPPQ